MTVADYTEDCCFNYVRDHCKGVGCPCACHVQQQRRRQTDADVRRAAVELTTAYLEDPYVTLTELKPRIVALIEALDGVR